MTTKKPSAMPSAKRGAKGDDTSYRPRMTDPVSGAKLRRGSPVAAANAAPTDYAKMRTVRPVARVTPGGIFSPEVAKADVGRVKDPVSGAPLKRGQPVEAAFDNSFAARQALAQRTMGEALKAGFRAPAKEEGPKIMNPGRGPVIPSPVSQGAASKGDGMRLKKPVKKVAKKKAR